MINVEGNYEEILEDLAGMDIRGPSAIGYHSAHERNSSSLNVGLFSLVTDECLNEEHYNDEVENACLMCNPDYEKPKLSVNDMREHFYLNDHDLKHGHMAVF